MNGLSVGTTVVGLDGSWILEGLSPLVGGDAITGMMIVEGIDSPLSNRVIVSAPINLIDRMPVHAITSPIPGGSESISGTSEPFAIIDVYVDGQYLGTTTADENGNWTLPGIDPFNDGAIVSATTSDGTGTLGTSEWSDPVIVGSRIGLLRRDTMTSLTEPKALNFVRQNPRDTAMDVLGQEQHGAARLSRSTTDKRILTLIRRYLQAATTDGGEVSPRNEGTPRKVHEARFDRERAHKSAYNGRGSRYNASDSYMN